MVIRQYVWLALERLQVGSKIRVTEKGYLFQSVKHAKTFTVYKTTEVLGDTGLGVNFNGIMYELEKSTHELKPFGEYSPHEGMKGALWE